MAQDLEDIADYLLEQIHNDCTGNEDHTYLILRVLSVSCIIVIISEALFLDTPPFSFCILIPSCCFSMQVIGNIGGRMEQLTSRLTPSILKCIQSTEPSLLIQKAAIQALRKMEIKDEVKSTEEG